ncbi:hypothetical protein [Exiguobacterium aurantiacum]|uniref:Uncharacterized protein n=1 Tax=Exiguobacterium aurantiacum TaxID=33987 RepID=A0ABY5FQ45_9BACL|nr:hypothetical protein [Exiguobacterium aurantiacum]UTT43706.1 hypothetical protein NMQ00_04155 [Exiguobacterium aurantiacum]
MNETSIMNEVAIKRHNFEMANNRLKEFAENTEAELEIDKVRTEGGFFGLGDHKVTGSELNRRLETIQQHFIAVNQINNKTIKEFREVYNVFDALDKEYITSIVTNVKAVEKTSNDVRVQQKTLKRHNEKLANQQNKLDAHQVEIENNVANISKIVTALKIFKEKLEGYKHLTDIDKIWTDCRDIQNEIRVVSDSISTFSKKTTEDIASANHKNKALSDQVNLDILTLRNEANSFKEFFSELSEKIEYTADVLENQIPVIQETASFAEQLKNITHIADVDAMWKDINEAIESLHTIDESLLTINADVLKKQDHIDKIESFVTMLKGFVHLKDLDSMWEDLDVSKTNIKKTNMEVHDILKRTEEHKLYIDQSKQTDKIHADKLDKLVQVDNSILKSIDSSEREINDLKRYKEKLNDISHLKDVDSIWKSVETHTSQLIESRKRDEELITAIQKNKDEVDEKIADAVKTSNAAVESLTQKVKYAYWIAGGAAGLAIIEMILLFMRVV